MDRSTKLDDYRLFYEKIAVQKYKNNIPPKKKPGRKPKFVRIPENILDDLDE